MKFKKLAEYFESIENTPSRLEMTEVLAELFKEASEHEIDQVVYLSLGRLRPKFDGIVFNLSETMMIRVISAAYGVKLAEVEELFKKIGDLGEVVEKLGEKDKTKNQDKGLTVATVYNRLMELAVDEGQGSQDRKVMAAARLIQELDLRSAKYVVRIPVNKLRLGFSDMTVLDALSWMEKGDKSLRPELERPFNVSADIGQIAQVFKEKGLRGISRIGIKVGVPIRAAQAERLPNAEKMVEKLEVFGVEGKWDGLRMQIHVDQARRLELKKQEGLFGGTKPLVRIFSRNLDNQTEMFPDVVAEATKLPIETVVLDGEAVAFDPKTNKLLSFQETVKRKRKHAVNQMAKEYPIKVFVYDLLYLNGENLIEKPFKYRRELLEKKVFKNNKLKKIVLADQEIVSDVRRLKELVKKYLNVGLEGVMCKKLTTTYQAGSRNFNWVKYKKIAAQGELVDTIDAVVMGYYPGKGRRSGFGIGAFLVGVRDVKGNIGSIAKIGTGLSDEQWREMKVRADKVKTEKKPDGYIVDKSLAPEVWCEPKIVTEIMADEITKSPIHAFSLALRFPRLVRFRDDKNWDEGTSKKELERLFKIQGDKI